MPLYEYECESCHERFERIQKFSDPPVEVCPACGGAVRRLISSPAIQFKGEGWYVTDYARAGAKKADREEKSAEKDGAATGDKTEKPAKTEAADKKAADKPAAADKPKASPS